MKFTKSMILSVMIACLSGISALDARATGFGFYLDAGVGSGEADITDGYFEYTFDSSNSHAGAGFIIDTNVLKERQLFNYRVSIGYERLKTELDEDIFARKNNIRWDGIVLENDFGFGRNVSERVRIWGGPCLRLSYHTGSDDFAHDFEVIGIGLGPVFGANFGMTNSFALSLRAGFLFNGYAGEWEDSFNSFIGDDFSMSEFRGFLNFSVLFGDLK